MNKLKTLAQKRSVARDISYASSAQTRAGRAVIRNLENITGRPRLIRKADGYELDVANGQDFWAVMIERYGVQIEYLRGARDKIPSEGPLVVVANHPFGILDGMIFGHLLSQARAGDFRIVAHQVFRKAEDLNKIILPIDFDETREAMKTNLATRKAAVDYLKNGGCVGIFPGGTVSTSVRPGARPMDPVWRNFTAKMIQKSGATVLPIYFDGVNSRLFQYASHLHYTLRMSLLIREFKRQIRNPVRVAIGEPIEPSDLRPYLHDANGLMTHLREVTYGLSPQPIADLSHGYEFERQYQ